MHILKVACNVFALQIKKFYSAVRHSCRLAAWRLRGKISKTLTIKTRQGRLTVYAKDSEIGKTLYCFRGFEEENIRLVMDFLKNKKMLHKKNAILDIGANMGVISIAMLSNGYMDSAIAIEPEPKNFALLKRNVQQNRMYDRVTCLQYAVSDRDGMLDFELDDNNFGDHRVRTNFASSGSQGERGRRVIKVKARRLDDIFHDLSNEHKDAISLAWIDVQGHEGKVFEGGGEFFNQNIPVYAEICPYTILRAGISKDEFCKILARYWSNYYVVRRGRFFGYPISLFGLFWDELGTEWDFENVLLMK